MKTTARAESASNPQRYTALDAFRGFNMILLISNGFGLLFLLGNPIYGGFASCFDHSEWAGLTFWDLVQPSFMFIVGVAMPFAINKRISEGFSKQRIFRHVVIRSIELILLSQILMIIVQQRLHFQLINVLSQIAFTYFLTYLIIQLKFRLQVVSAGLILLFYSLLFAIYPGGFSQTNNIGAVFDRIILGENYPGYYVTINFIPSTVTTLVGAWTGMLLLDVKTVGWKLKILLFSALLSLTLGLTLGWFIPIVKRIWTASFTLYSLGWVLLMMFGFVVFFDYLNFRKAAFPFIVVGMNSLFSYSMGLLLTSTIDTWLRPFTGGFAFVGIFAPVAQQLAILTVMWLIVYWLYKRRVFFHI
jgi:predicted acyltransferase